MYVIIYRKVWNYYEHVCLSSNEEEMIIMSKQNNNSMIVKHASINSVDYIPLAGLNKEQLQKKKEQLIRQHVENAIKKIVYFNNDSMKKMCESRIFFVKKDDILVLCGLYNVSEKHFKTGPIEKTITQACDYLLYNENSGFYFVMDCSTPFDDRFNSRNTSPAIYYQPNGEDEYRLLEYGETYDCSTLNNLQVKYNARKYFPEDSMTYHLIALINTSIVHEVKSATLYSELPMIPNYYVYTTEKDHMTWLVYSFLVDIVTRKKKLLQLQEGFSFHHHYNYDFSTKLSRVMVDLYDKKRCIYDNDNYYFYISRTDTFAFEEIMRRAKTVGKIEQIDNMIEYDATVNYKITIPKNDSTGVAAFIFGVVCKSYVVFPAILGCPIHAIVDILCGESESMNDIDSVTTKNTIFLIKEHFGELPNWKIVALITSYYGSYAARSQPSKYWMYYHGAGLRETVDGNLIESLRAQTYSVKWVSEYSLYKIVLYYYADAIIHYNAKWLGKQHLDIYIPSLLIGIEYQGQQHYEITDYFGGELGFYDRKFMDDTKRKLCKANNVILIEWPYTTAINTANFITQLLLNGIHNIPIPDPFRIPQKEEVIIPEEKTAYDIRQYSIEGKLLSRYSSFEDASDATGISLRAIKKAISGYSNTAGGYQWRKVTARDPINDIEPVQASISTGKSTPVLQVSLYGEIIAEYPSISNAAKAVGINSKSISCVLNGTQKKAGNYYWIYKETE